jgi:hypothetical protein
MEIPSDYTQGYEKVRVLEPELASSYVAHTMVGDPVADAAIEELASLDRAEATLFIKSLMDQEDEEAFRDAPPALKALFDEMESPPDWVDLAAFTPGVRMFHRNSKLVLGAFVGGVLVEGFSTNISKSFFITGRVRDQGVRRLKQNNRHMLEIFMPGSMEKHADGWAISIRVRLVHAKIRYLLTKSSEWNTENLGTPISSAHLGFAISAFSARLLKHLKNLGASFNAEERKSFMAVWRYSGYLMGIPETILFRHEQDALEIFRIGKICEPPPSMESIAMASSLINSAPLVAGITQAQDRQKLAAHVAQISRALIGNTLADELMYPKASTFGILWRFRMLNRIEKIMGKLNWRRSPEVINLTTILDVSTFDKEGISYKLPDHIHAEQSSKW